MKKKMTHWRKGDYRFESLYVTINGLDKSIKKKEVKKEISSPLSLSLFK